MVPYKPFYRNLVIFCAISILLLMGQMWAISTQHSFQLHDWMLTVPAIGLTAEASLEVLIPLMNRRMRSNRR